MLLKKELISVGVEAKDAEEVLLSVAEKFVASGYVEVGFPQAVADREAIFPTGLPAAGMDVAIPHTEDPYVIEPALSIVTMREPVEFKMMGSPEILLMPKILFVLAVTSAHSYLEVLQRLIELIHDEDVLAACYACATADEVYDLMAPLIGL